MTSVAAANPARAMGRFAPWHRWDRNLFLLYVALNWFGVVMGFGPAIARHISTHKPPYPLVVHLHAAAFLGWLLLLTVQIVLIRTGRPQIHRRLGIVGVALALVMVIVGPATAIIVQRHALGTPDSDPAFLSVQLGDILAFAGLAAFAVVMRETASAHKRLILLATLAITDAGFARWLGEPLHKLLGEGVVSSWAQLYGANVVLIAGLGAYDLITRRRLHPVYIAGALWIFAAETAAIGLYLTPSWKAVALRLIGH